VDCRPAVTITSPNHSPSPNSSPACRRCSVAPRKARNRPALPAAISPSILLTREASRAGERIDLQPREFSLLEFLMRHPGRPVSKTMILEHVWDYSFDPGTNVVDVLVHRLRAKIDPDKTRLHTLRGVGYVLRPA
jgi:two-component system OmpR family response regulator